MPACAACRQWESSSLSGKPLLWERMYGDEGLWTTFFAVKVQVRLPTPGRGCCWSLPSQTGALLRPSCAELHVNTLFASGSRHRQLRWRVMHVARNCETFLFEVDEVRGVAQLVLQPRTKRDIAAFVSAFPTWRPLRGEAELRRLGVTVTPTQAARLLVRPEAADLPRSQPACAPLDASCAEHVCVQAVVAAREAGANVEAAAAMVAEVYPFAMPPLEWVDAACRAMTPGTLLPHQMATVAWAMWRESTCSLHTTLLGELGGKGSAAEVILRPALTHVDSDDPAWGRAPNDVDLHAMNGLEGPGPRGVGGGFIADEMGMGKTRCVLALVSADSPSFRQTLVVTPVSLMGQWLHEAAALGVGPAVQHYGPGRRTPKHAAAVAFARVVVTTYEVLSQEHQRHVGAQGSELFSRSWHRVVFDESQRLRSPDTAVVRAACAVQAACRWCVSGTPVASSCSGWSGQLKALRVPVAHLYRGVFAGSSSVLMGEDAVRWLKDAIVRHTLATATLPSAAVRFSQVRVQLSAADAELYAAVRSRVAAVARSNARDASQLLLALRRASTTTAAQTARLLVESVAGTAEGAGGAASGLPSGCTWTTTRCPVCWDEVGCGVLGAFDCDHSVCSHCLADMLRSTGSAGCYVCPLCRAGLRPRISRLAMADRLQLAAPPAPDAGPSAGTGAAAAAPAPSDPASHPASGAGALHAACKLAAVVQVLTSAPGAAVVFSAFNDTVQAVLQGLGDAGLTHVFTLTGSMSATARARAVARFDAAPRGVLVMSLRAAAVGLNLMHASTVVFMEPPTEASIEAQAIGRVVRLGQRAAEVHVVHVLAAGTMDEIVLAHRGDGTADDDGGAAGGAGGGGVLRVEHVHRAGDGTRKLLLLGLGPSATGARRGDSTT